MKKKIPITLCLMTAYALLLGSLNVAGQSNNGVPAPSRPASTLLVSATDDQIAALINQSNFGLVMMKRNYMACHRTQLKNGDDPPIDPGAVTPYVAWLNYIAAHIKSHMPFGDDYTPVAAGALDLTGWTDTNGEICLNSHIRDPQRVTLIMSADPVKIGKALYDSFSRYDQSTCDRAASQIAQ